ncbi:MAG: hypothetical protein RLO17_22750 [Cyclobacteriaceae bacterium]
MDIDRTKYKVWDGKNLNVIIWKINPALAFNELVLGQRIPKITLFDNTSDKPLIERTYIPCPHCETYHDGRTWSWQNKTAAKNWFGLYCPDCGDVIPCIRNWMAGLILTLTYPLCFWWIKTWKQSWLDEQPSRYVNIIVELVEHKQVNWIKLGLLWGVLMYVTMQLLNPLLLGRDYKLVDFIVGIPIWLAGGLMFGWLMKWWMRRNAKRLKINNF